MELVCIAPRELENVVRAELGGRILGQRGRVFLVRGSEPVLFGQNTWLKPKFQEVSSISQGAKFLKSIQRNWSLFSTNHHRRAALIQEQLPPLKNSRVQAYSQVPQAPLGGWTLWEENKILYSEECTSPFPNGEIEFVEDKIGPPSRAYLKLWELFLLEGRWPGKDERVIDLGSSPGGWTWALDQLGCEVVSVDKAPLAEGLKLSNRVRYINENAFNIKAEDIGHVDWLFSDIICYPDKLLELVEKWHAKKLVKNFVCTIKFQGNTDFSALRKFSDISGSEILHLYNNKHELTFVLRG